MKPAPFTHCVFDAYGTLFDVHSAVGRYRESLGEKADAVSVHWRSKQLEYTWLRSLMRQHVDSGRSLPMPWIMPFHSGD